jgi:hypothetical protein
VGVVCVYTKLLTWLRLVPVVGFDPTTSLLWSDNHQQIRHRCRITVDGVKRSATELYWLKYLHQAINSAKTKIPPTGFDPVSSGSWCDNHPQFGPSLVNNGEDGVLRRASTALQRVKSVLVERWTIPCGWKFDWKILCLDLFINHLQIPAWIPYLHLQFLLHASLIYITI